MEAEKAFASHCLSNTPAVHGSPFHMLEVEKSFISSEETNPKLELIPCEVRIAGIFLYFKILSGAIQYR